MLLLDLPLRTKLMQLFAAVIFTDDISISEMRPAMKFVNFYFRFRQYFCQV